LSEVRKPLALVVAMAQNRVIGRAGGIPWDLPEDRKHFVHVTRGHAIIMGRATWDSIGKPLPKRRNIVISRRPGLALGGAEVVSSLEEAIALARQQDDEPRIIGGGEIYALALPLATRLYLTVLDDAVSGDSYFPELDANAWQVTEERRGEGVWFRTLERR
jgi:dihydrofolate reductase